MDPIGVLPRALDQTGYLLDHVRADVLERPAPPGAGPDERIAAFAGRRVTR